MLNYEVSSLIEIHFLPRVALRWYCSLNSNKKRQMAIKSCFQGPVLLRKIRNFGKTRKEKFVRRRENRRDLPTQSLELVDV